MKLKIDATYDLFEAADGMVEFVAWESHIRRSDRLIETHGEWQRASTKQRYLGTLYGPGLTAETLQRLPLFIQRERAKLWRGKGMKWPSETMMK